MNKALATLVLVLACFAALLGMARPLHAAVSLPAPQWTTVSPPYEEQFRGIGFADELNGCAIADDCYYVTNDGGHTWAKKDDLAGLRDIDYAAGAAWAVGDAGLIVTSVDGGKTWQPQASGVSVELDDVDFIDATHGWAASATGEILATIDGGATWALVGAVPGGYRPELAFSDASHGWALSHNDLWRSDDGGASWERDPQLGTDASLFFVRFFDALHGWTGGNDGVWSTSDGGETWTAAHGLSLTPTDVASTGDGQHVWAIDRYPHIAVSEDGGHTWHQQAIGNTYASPGDMQLAIVGDHGWATAVASGYSGWGIIHTDKSGYADATPPTTLITPLGLDGWQTSVVPVSLSPSDAGSGVSTTYYKVASGFSVDWRIGTSFTVPLAGAQGPDGKYIVSYLSTDVYGNVEQENTLSIWVDLHAPVTTLTPAGEQQMDYWTNKGSSIKVSATDGGGSGVVATYVDLDGAGDAAWNLTQPIVTPAPTDHSNDGVHTITVHSVDAAGHNELLQQHSVAIDTRRPVPAAPYAARCAYHGYATLKFRINDRKPCASKGMVQIRIRDSHGRVVGLLSPAKWFPKNQLVSYRFHCPLRRGTYRFCVRSYDGAGNVSLKDARNTLTIK